MLTTPYRQFICWMAVTRDDKVIKLPVSPYTGKVCDAHDRSQWVSLQEAQASGKGNGVAFVFADSDPFFFLDIDHCLTADGWSPLAVHLCQQFAGCFVEVSQSGTGLHILGTRLDSGEHGCRNGQYGLELYTTGRFCALTFTGCSGSLAHGVDLTPLLTLPGWSGSTLAPGTLPAEWSTGPVPEWSGPTDDIDLLARMMAVKPSAGSILGGRATLQDLWLGNAEALSLSYPDPRGYDCSSADAALCAHLAFWTGKDCERMDRLFRQSALMRDKWDRGAGSRGTYGVITILNAVTHTTNVLGKRETSQTGSEETEGIEGLRGGSQFMGVSGQVSHFTGCVYIRDLHRVLIPDGGLLKSEQFNATMGGHIFSLDLVGEKTTRKAFEAFTECMGYNFPKAQEACFRPECEPAAMIEEEGRLMVNVYTPITTSSTPGDPSPFVNHVSRLIPNPSDRAILLAYMAALVQYPGVKFQWCPLIQGVQGNGKTLLITSLTHAVGSRYSHLPNPEDIANKFNSWILGKLFIGVEEVYVADRRELVNVLKPLVTNKRVDIQGKGTDQKTGDNRANFLMTTNHKEAMPITDDDRRYAIFFCAQQHLEDLARDGMLGSYFPDLYRWADNGGYAIINHYLRSYPIPPALNPAGACHRAPVTSSTGEAIRSSMGSIEQEVMEAIEEGRPGFAGGWVSSLALDRLLEEKRLSNRLPRARRKELLQSLGYEWHPALGNGRVHNAFIDVGGIAGKPVLYIKRGHPAAVLVGREVVQAYQQIQAGCTQAAIILGGGQ